MENIKIVIPARRNSKGLPFKNRILFYQTVNKIPKKYLEHVIVSSDDEVIIEECANSGITCDVRKPELAEDTISTKDVLVDLLDRGLITEEHTVIMLYLTYPERTWKDIKKALDWFQNHRTYSLLCKKEIKGTHPYLYMFESGEHWGEQLVHHDLYRRQDYPKVFEISHFICIFKAKALKFLNNNLYYHHTFFYPINDVVDVDTENDLKQVNDEDITH